MSREYKKRKRAESEAETRQRIAAAAAELHGSIGPAQTSISAVADRAGVQRATVYRHFPDEPSLFAACSAHWAASNPAPDPGPWLAIEDPDERLRTVLDGLYRWYGSAEAMLTNLHRDRAIMPAVATQMDATAVPYMQSVLEIALSGLRGKRLRAATAHALEFTTWRSLVRDQGLAPAQAIDLMAKMVAAA